jgi:putative membrane protein
LAPAEGHRLIWITQQIYQWVERQKQAGIVDGDELRAIDMELSKLLDICGGCERIARTPFVGSYRTFSRQCVVLFLLTLPWGIAHDFGWWTIPLTVLLSYFMIGMETVAEHVEEPFGLDEDDLDLESLCRTIEKSVNEVFERSSC